jgi:UDP-N-acetylglucosamine kinase
MTDKKIKEKAVAFAKANKDRIAREIVLDERYPVETNPVSIFMAGSPGAGKTESARRLIKNITSNYPTQSILHIDTDDLRRYFEDYTGSNSYLFQGGTSILASRIQDYARKYQKSFIFDGTLSDFKRAKENIEMSLKNDRTIGIYFVYQDPIKAWQFVLEREKKEGRHIPSEDFVAKYFSSYETVKELMHAFGKSINVDLLIKDIDGADLEYYMNIASLDGYIKNRYNKDDLMKRIDYDKTST